MSNQNFISASEYCDSVRDGTHDSPKKTECGIKLVTSKNIIGGYLDLTSAYFISESDAANINKRSKVDINDVLLSMIGTVGEVALISEQPNFVIKNVGLFKNNDEKKAKWLYYYLRSREAQHLIKERLKGTTQQYIPLGELRNLPILQPKNSEHLEKTVDYLSALDDKIRLNTQTNQTLEQIAQAIYKSWFVDYEPTCAKAAVLAAGGSMAEAETAAMTAISGKTAADLAALAQNHPARYQQLADLAAAFPAALVPTDDFGEIPEGWEICTLKECSRKIQNGGTPKRGNAEFWDDGTIPWLSSGEVCNNKILIKSKEFITQSGLDNSSAKLVPSHSTLVAIYASPTAGKCSFCAFESTTNQAVCAVVPKSGYQYFNYFYLQRQEQYYVSQASGSAQQNISKKIVEETPIFQPTKEILGAFNKIIQPIMDKQISNLIENSKLEETRDSLLPKLINNELKRE